jgi:hypothetical protein
MGCICLGVWYYFSLNDEIIAAICTWSGTYFMADSMHYANWSLMQIHHYASVILMFFIYRFYYDKTNINYEAVFWGLFWCEVSNIPIYYVYHYKCVQQELPRYIYMWEFIQFSSIRIGCALYYLLVKPVTSNFVCTVILGVLVLSMYWAKNMVKYII